MLKPGKSRLWLILGIILQGIGGAIYFGGVVNSLKATLYSDNASGPSMAIGALVVFIGWISLLVGVSRASAGIDYLVAAVRDDVPSKSSS